MKNFSFIFLFTSLLGISSSWAKLMGTVQSCHDGDTCRIQIQGKNVKVRIFGIDAPELGQPYGPSAKRFLEDLVKGKEVTLECFGRSYQRRVCRLFYEAQDVGGRIVREGWAWDSPKYSMGLYQTEQQLARAGKLGIWQTEQQRSPFCFRHAADKSCRQSHSYQP